MSVHAGMDSTRYVRLLWEPLEEDDKNSHAAMFEMKIGNKPEEVIVGPGERTAASVFNDLESVALAIESSDLDIAEDNFVPTARCIQDTKERQLVTRSGLQRLWCCVCHLHHESAMNALASVRQFFQNSSSRSMSLLEMPTRQHTSTTKSKSTKICTILQLPLC